MTRTGVKAIAAQERRALCIRLRKEGYSYSEIGKRAGCTEQRAWQIIDDYVKKAAKLVMVDAVDLKVMEMDRIDMVVQAMIPGAMKGDPKAAMVLLAASKRRSMLMGLDAPKRVVEEKPDDIDAQLDRLLTRARERSGVPEPQSPGEIPAPMEADGATGAVDAPGRLVVLDVPCGSRVGEDASRG